MTKEEIMKLNDDELEAALNQAIVDASNNEKYEGTVFETSHVYFVVANDKIGEISNDASCGPKGGWFPDIIKGLSQEQNDYIESLIEQYDIDECFFDDFFNSTGAEEEEDIEECIEDYVDGLDDEEKEDFLSVYEKVEADEETVSFPFRNASELVMKFNRLGLEENLLYYEWEGMYIDLYDNICETGENKGEYDNHSDRDWLYILTNLDEYIVTAIN